MRQMEQNISGLLRIQSTILEELNIPPAVVIKRENKQMVKMFRTRHNRSRENCLYSK